MALDTNDESPAVASSSSQSTQPSDSESTPKLNDGIYNAQGSYRTPGGTESIALTVTLENSIIKDIDLEQQASGGDTEVYQAKFASGYKPLVIGKNIDEVKLTRVAGSSLTSNGFNEALKQIKLDATS
jgi:hypothetical protein